MLNSSASRLLLFASMVFAATSAAANERLPNILVAISDDHSWPHASAYGCRAVATPAFDRVAKSGVLFTRAFAASPGCSPSRAALLTGRHTWMIEEAGTHASSFPKKYSVFPELLEKAGYHVGMSGKGWGPGNWQIDGWPHNPAGRAYDNRKLTPPHAGIRNIELANTLVIVTGDNGMPFPRAKATCYEYGIHVPLAIAWPAREPGGRTVDDLVGFVDLTATILEATGVSMPDGALQFVGRSLVGALQSRREGSVDPARRFVFVARERHSHA